MPESAQFTPTPTGGRYEVLHTDCPARDIVDHITSRWGVWVLISLRGNDLRFFELRQSIEGVSEKMLAQTLRALVRDDLVWRKVEPTAPPQVSYGLTEFGREIGDQLAVLFGHITRRLSREGGQRPQKSSGSDSTSDAVSSR
jgi:DNA-binding HxlR family transcriptional regulator